MINRYSPDILPPFFRWLVAVHPMPKKKTPEEVPEDAGSEDEDPGSLDGQTKHHFEVHII